MDIIKCHFFVVAALIYDNAIYALGTFIGEGTFLKTLNLLRFWLHALITPTLILFSIASMREANIKWAQQSWVLLFGVLYTIVAIFIEIITVLNGLVLQASKEYGALSYSSAEEASGPPIMILMVLIALLIAGFMLWWKAKWPWMFIGTLIMIIGSVVSFDINSNAMTNAFELILLFTLVWTKKQLDLNRLYVH
ncbi:phospholipid phosphatase [Gracilibacillus marinus]|uniref:Phospholipid phosphatase n=1 Tax=Gracilibacillus marinus TaxID=630535 RepID=A0ABV8VZE4_9BACI